jgi:hypothetical protein
MSLLKRRIGILAVAVCLALSVAGLGAQSTRQIALPRKNMTLSELLSTIERQTGMVVVVNTDRIDSHRSVTVTTTSGTLSDLLGDALAGTGCTYQIVDRYLIITPATERTRTVERVPATERTPPREIAARPVGGEFERSVRDYTRDNIATERQPVVRYDTVRTERPNNGVFRYPNRSLTAQSTGRDVSSPFGQYDLPKLALKTNLVWWGTVTPNLAAEIGLGRRTSLEIVGANNRANLEGSEQNNKKLVHWEIKPEFRYWFCERFNGHFVGVHGIYGKYNVSQWDIPTMFEKEFRYEGSAFGGGVSYGYLLPLGNSWGLEFTAGVGALQMEYVKKDCEKCGREVGKFSKTWMGPTSLGVKVMFMIK